MAIRRSRGIGAADVALVDLDDDVVSFDITTDAGTTRVVMNLGEENCPILPNAEVLIASEPGNTDTLPTDHAVWLAVG